MTRKPTSNSFLSIVVVVLTVLISSTALSQTTEYRRLPRAVTNERASVGHQQNEFRSGGSDSQNPLFLPAVLYDSGGGSGDRFSLAVADVNGDGKPDLVVTNTTSTIGVLLGNGDGTFQPPLIYDSGALEPFSIAVGDLNGDGKPDVALIAGDTPIAIRVLLGNGDGTFQVPVAYDAAASNPLNIVIADVNGDGKPDLLVAAEGEGYYSSVSVLLGNGDGTFQAAVTYYGGGSFGEFVAVADVNSDGKPDLIVANDTGVGVLLGKGDGTFLPAVSYLAPGSSVTVADVNGDGKPDLLVLSDVGTDVNHHLGTAISVGVLLGNGDGTFQTPLIDIAAAGESFSLAVADVNGDGKTDVFVVNAGFDLVDALLGNGDGTFQSPSTYASGAGGTSLSLVAADVNGDGKPDLIVADYSFCKCANEGGIAVLLSGTGSRDPTTTTVASSANPAATGQTVTYTAAVKRETGGAATGTVMFKDGSKLVAIVGLVGNQASWSTSYLKLGLHSITAEYPGDANSTGSSATVAEHIALLPVGSTTRVATSMSPSLVGQSVTFTATVTAYYPTIPDGELVTFYDGITKLNSAPLAGGRAVYTTSSLSAKTHYIKASYAGDAAFKSSTGEVTQVVNKYPTTTSVRSSENPSAYGHAVTFVARVTHTGTNAPTGKVIFRDGTTGIASATVSNSLAKITRSNLSAGTHPITAEYLGDAFNDKSTSSVVNQVVK